jgi:hypothetical protein
MKGISGTEAVAGLGLLEITNPALQVRWFLRSAGYKDTVVFVVTELGFMVVFLMRIIGGSYLFYRTVSHPRPDIEAKALATAFSILSWVFMIYIFHYFIAKYYKHRKDQAP